MKQTESAVMLFQTQRTSSWASCVRVGIALALGLGLIAGDLSLFAQSAHVSFVTTLTAPAGGKSSPALVTFVFDGERNVGASSVLTLGAPGLDFKDTGMGTCKTNGPEWTYRKGDSCTVQISFSPTFPGLKLGAVELSEGATVIGTARLAGMATGPMASFPSIASSSLIAQIPSTSDEKPRSNAPVAHIGVAVDGQGDVYIADSIHGEVRKIEAINGSLTSNPTISIVGSGFSAPAALAIDGSGDVFVTDNGAVKEIVAVRGSVNASSAVVTLASGYPSLQALTVDNNGNVFFSDAFQNQIYEIVATNGVLTPTSAVTRVLAGFSNNGSGGPQALDLSTYALAMGPHGNVIAVGVDREGTKRAVKILGADRIVSPALESLQLDSPSAPADVSFDSAGDLFYIDRSSLRVAEYLPGLEASKLVYDAAASSSSPSGIFLDGKGNLFVTTIGKNTISVWKLDLGNPSTVEFQATAPGATSSPQEITLQNIGNADLTLTSSNGINLTLPAEFALEAEDAGSTSITAASCFSKMRAPDEATTLTPGSQCTDVLRFKPSVASSKVVQGQLAYANTDLSTKPVEYVTEVVPLAGIVRDATSTTASVSPASLSFTSAVGTASAAQTVTLTNTGTLTLTINSISLSSTASPQIHRKTQPASRVRALETSTGGPFVETDSCGTSLAAGASCAISITFQPSTTGSATEYLIVNDNAASNPQTVQLSGTGTTPTGTPKVNLIPGSLTLPVPVGYSYSQSVSIFNIGTAPLQISAIAITGVDANQFSQTNNCPSALPVQGSCSVSVTITPTKIGNFTAALSITDNAAGSPQMVPITGQGDPAQTSVTVSPTSLSFTASTNTQSAPQYVTIKNLGNSYLILNSVTLTGPGASAFQALPISCFDVAIGGVCGPAVVFQPTTAGTFDATLTINDNSTSSPHVIPLSGVATANTTFAAHFSGPTVTIGSGFNKPNGAVVDGRGDVFVADSGNNAIKEIVAVHGQVTSSSQVVTVGSGFSNPTRLAFDSNYDLFVSDTGNNAIKEILATDGQVSSSSQVIAVGSSFSQPVGVSVDPAGDVFVADTGNNAIKEIVAVDGKVSASSSVISVGSGFKKPMDIYLQASPLGSGAPYYNLYVDDTGNQTIDMMDNNSTPFSAATKVTTMPLSFASPGFAFGSSYGGTLEFVINQTSKSLVEYSAYELVGLNGLLGNATTVLSGLSQPTGAATDNAGYVFVTDQGDNTVKALAQNALKAPPTPVGTSSGVVLVPFVFDGPGTLGSWQVSTQGAANLDFTEVPASTTCAKISYTAGQSCSVAVKFSPLHAGWRLGAVQLLDGSGKAIAIGNLEGIGVAPQIVFPSNTTRFTAGTGSELEDPQGIFVAANGNVFVQDQFTGNFRINAVNGLVTPTSTATALANYTCGVTFNPDVDGAGNEYQSGECANAYSDAYAFGEALAVNGQLGPNSTIVTPQNASQFPPAPNTTYLSATDASGDVFSANGTGNVVTETLGINEQAFANATNVTAASGFYQPDGVALDGAGNLYVTEEGNFVTTPGSPQVYVFPFASVPSLTFPTPTAAGTTDTTDGPLQVIVANNGNAPLIFPALASANAKSAHANDTPAGVNPSLTGDFKWDSSSTCEQTQPGSSTPFTLAPGARCIIAVDFAPSGTGKLTGAITIVDNALNTTAGNYATQVIPLTGVGGTGGTPTVSISPAGPLTYSSIVGATSAAQTVTLTNSGASPATISGITLTGANPSDFAIQSNTCSGTLNYGTSCTVSVTFTPASAATFNANLSFADNASGSPQTLALTGTGISKIGTTTTLSANPALVPEGSSTTVTVTVTASTGSGTPTGSVTIMDGPANLGTATLSGNTASLTLQYLYLIPGSQSLTAIYSGDSNYATSTSAPITVSRDNTTPATYTTLTATPTTAASGSNVSFAATVVAAAGTKTPAGTVQFMTQLTNGQRNVLGTGTLNSAGVAVFNTTALPLGFSSIYADYLGNANNLQSFSSIVAVQVNASTSPTVSVTPSSLSFTGTTNTTSAAQKISVKNTSTTALSLSGISVGGANFTSFAQTNTCGTSVAAGASCSISVTFTSASAGTFNGAITIADNASGSPQIVTLSGTATAPVLTSTMTTVTASANPATVGSAVKLTATVVTASGVPVSAGSIVFLSGGTQLGTASLSASGAATLSHTFNAAGTASITAYFSGAATDSSSKSPTLPLSVQASSAPVASLSPSNYNFSNQIAGKTSAAASFQLSNTGNASLTGITASLTGAGASDFAIVSGTGSCGTSLAAGASCKLYVTFTPASAASFSSSLAVADNATGSPQTVALTGTGTTAAAPAVSLSPAALTFTTQTGTTSAAQTVTLKNTGSAPLMINGISLNGSGAADFAQTSTCGSSLAASASCSIAITFKPSSAASFSASLAVADNATGSPQAVALTGIGTAAAVPVVNLTPGSLSFGNETVGTESAAQTVTLKNTGTASLTGIAISLHENNSQSAAKRLTGLSTNITSADYSATTTCASTLAAGANCTISVVFDPASAGTLPATLTVADNASNSPQTVSLTGTGVAPSAPVVTLTPSALTFVSQVTGTTSTAQVATLKNTGNTTLSVTGITVTGSGAAAFAQTNTCGSSVAVGASCAISVTFTPASAASFAATISIADNAAGEPQTVSLSGTGTLMPTFTVSSATTPQTVQPGGVAKYVITVAAQNGAYPGSISLSAAGLPTGATATFSPSSLSPGSGSANSQLNIQTSSSISSAGPTSAWALAAAMLPFAALLFAVRKFRQRWIIVVILSIASLGALTTISGCGGGVSLKPMSYNITVNATSGTMQQSTVVQLTVQ